MDKTARPSHFKSGYSNLQPGTASFRRGITFLKNPLQEVNDVSLKGY